jgi:hypothetical protein
MKKSTIEALANTPIGEKCRINSRLTVEPTMDDEKGTGCFQKCAFEMTKDDSCPSFEWQTECVGSAKIHCSGEEAYFKKVKL